MEKYLYTARDERGKVIKGIMIAESEAALSDKISRLGYYLTSFRTTSQSVNIEKEERKKSLKINPKEVLRIAFQMATLLEAGLPLLEGLKDLAREADDNRIQRLLDDIRYRVESGSTLKDALTRHPQSFSPLFTSLVGAGETTGKLAKALEDLAALLEWQLDLKSKIKEAAIYPIILSIVMVGVVVLLVVKVIPMFKPIFEELETALPLATQVVLGMSDVVTKYWYIFIMVVVVFVVVYNIYDKTEQGHYNLDGIKLKLPLFGELTRKIALSRFSHTFSLSFKAGINLLTCLDISRDTAGNACIERAIKKAKESVNVGEKLATSLQVTGEFPPMVIRMIAVGEQSGALAETLTKVAIFYDKEVASTIKKIFTAFEPIMIVMMGVVVGGIAMSVFLPMFQMLQKFG